MNAQVKPKSRIAMPNTDAGRHGEILAGALTYLNKRDRVEVDFINIPDEKNDIYLRRVTAIKSPSKGVDIKPESPEQDCCELMDLPEAAIPWMGFVKLGALVSRQFRSRNIITANVDVIREIGGYLYLMRCGFREMTELRPVFVEMLPSTRRHVQYRLSTTDLLDCEIKHHFGDAPPVPDKLRDELTSIGFVQDGKQFDWSDEKQRMRITIDLYGKFITPM